MSAIEVLSRLTFDGVTFIDPSEGAELVKAGVVAGKVSDVTLPVQANIRLECQVKLSLDYKKAWIHKRTFRAEMGQFALNGKTLDEAKMLLTQVEELHYRDLLGAV